MPLLRLAYKSLHNRRLTTLLSLLSIALSVALLVGVEHVRLGIRENFSHTISQTDLIVGARGGAIQLLLYTVFGMGSPTSNLSYASYETLKRHPAVKWTIPYSLGDSHRGFRVIGTNADFYTEYRYRQNRRLGFAAGRAPRDIFEVALGAEVARQLGYTLDTPIVLTHGITRGPGLLTHEDKPFRVVGVLHRTATPIDRALYIPLEGMEAIHIDWQEGAPPRSGETIPTAVLRQEDIQIKQITAFFLAAKSRLDTLRLQREINAFAAEPVMAIIPGGALSELWRGIGYAEEGLRVVTVCVVIVGFLGMLMSLYTALNERRREMAILRAIGVGPGRILFLLVCESSLLSVAGCVLGVALVYTALLVAQPVVEQSFGLYIPLRALTRGEYTYLGASILGGSVLGLVPAWKAYRHTLSDGLSMRL